MPVLSNGDGCVIFAVGLRLSAGTYHVSARVEDGFHIYFPCSKDRTQPFEIDFSGVFLYFTVSLCVFSARTRARLCTLQ